jgi:hydrogenase nickel incorporation protein HypA/HybF
MHELSIANSIVELALQYVNPARDGRVSQINLSIGSLSCVHRDALLFSFDLITADTPLAGAKLHITELPIVIYCPTCDCLQELPGVQQFRCPVCLTPSADIRQGQELDIVSIELTETESVEPELVGAESATIQSSAIKGIRP